MIISKLHMIPIKANNHMKILLLLFLLFTVLISEAQQKEQFLIEGQLVGQDGLPVEDAYIFNFRETDKYVSRANGVFKIWVQASDSLAISHISYLRKVVSVFDIMMSPIVTLVKDSIYLKDINVSPSQRTEREIAMRNIKSIDFDFRTNPNDLYTDDGEQMQEMLKTHNRVERSAASSVSIVRFSPSEIFGNIRKKRQQKKEAKKVQ
jgi:hypothetical protein